MDQFLKDKAMELITGREGQNAIAKRVFPGYTEEEINELREEYFKTTCESCTHNNDCSMQHAASLSGNGDGFGCTVHNAKEKE